MFIKAVSEGGSEVVWETKTFHWEKHGVFTFRDFGRAFDNGVFYNPFGVLYPELDAKDLGEEFQFYRLSVNGEQVLIPTNAGMFVMSDTGQTIDRLN